MSLKMNPEYVQTSFSQSERQQSVASGRKTFKSERESSYSRKSVAYMLASQRRMKRLQSVETQKTQSREQFERIIKEIMENQKVCEDWKDHSENPSYSKFEVPYFMQCRDRYKASQETYEKQFQREIALLLENNTSAYEVARATRHLGITTLWPPLHNRREIIYTQRYFFRLKPQERSRLNYIMTHDFN